MIKIIAPYQISRYKILELVVEYELISSSDYYDPTSILEVITQSWLRKNPLSSSGAATISCSDIKYECVCGWGWGRERGRVALGCQGWWHLGYNRYKYGWNWMCDRCRRNS
jgi:hypothetical protein